MVLGLSPINVGDDSHNQSEENMEEDNLDNLAKLLCKRSPTINEVYEDDPKSRPKTKSQRPHSDASKQEAEKPQKKDAPIIKKAKTQPTDSQQIMSPTDILIAVEKCSSPSVCHEQSTSGAAWGTSGGSKELATTTST